MSKKRLTVYHKALAVYKKDNPKATHKQAIKAYQRAKKAFTKQLIKESKSAAKRLKTQPALRGRSYRGQISKRLITESWSWFGASFIIEKPHQTLKSYKLTEEQNRIITPLWRGVRGNSEAKELLVNVVRTLPKLLGRRKHFRKQVLLYLKQIMDAAGIPIGVQMPVFRTAYRKTAYGRSGNKNLRS